MEQAKDKILKIFDLIGFDKVQLEDSDKEDRLSIRVKDRSIKDSRVPELVGALTHLSKQIARKEEGLQVLVDINDYRKERETLIIKLARAAAKKAATTQERVALPAMNAYERLIVHTELSTRPDVATESEGEHRSRHVVVRPEEF